MGKVVPYSSLTVQFVYSKFLNVEDVFDSVHTVLNACGDG